MKKILFIFFLAFWFVNTNAQNPIYYLLIGTYTDGGTNDGIHIYRFNPNKGEATFVSKTSGVANPSWLCVSKDGKFVYSVNENSGTTPGEVSSFAFDKKKGALTFLNKQPTDGFAPAYITVDSDGKNVITANYSGGNISVFKTNADGSLQPHVQVLAHDGYGVNVQRQEMPHPHQVVISPDGKYVFAPDLGNDRLYQYKLNNSDATNVLTESDSAYYTVDDGFGPRHIVFSPDSKHAYLLNELSGQIIVYSYANGKLKPVQTIASTTAGEKNDRGSAEIAITPNGRFLYTTNRGVANDIALYKVQTDGTLIENGHQAVNANPRSFMIDPTGHFLLVASQNNNTIQIFVINKNYGLLENGSTLITDVQKPGLPANGAGKLKFFFRLFQQVIQYKRYNLLKNKSMKKIYLLLAVCVVIGTSIQAQKKVNLQRPQNVKQLPKAKEYGTNGIEGLGCDTVNLPTPANWHLTYYTYDFLDPIDSGFISGTNLYDDKEKANYFDLSVQNYNYIEGTAVYFAVANSSTAANLSKNVVFKVYADDNGYPGEQLGTSVSIPLSSIKADVAGNFFTNVSFPEPIALPASKKIYVSADISAFSLSSGDSIAIVSTTDGDLTSGTGTAFEKWSDDSWHNFNIDSTYDFDAALAIFPYVSTTQGACGVLPVKLISFDAERQNKNAIINWKVAEEINMKGYQLEKAANDNNYKPVTFIPAHNDLKNVTYSYTDANAFVNAGNIQYRLKQIDNDGKVQYSRVISLKAASALNNVSFANPFNSSLHMQLNLSSPSQVKINVYDVKGSLVGSEKPASYGAASSSVDIKSTTGLKAGMYFIKLMVGNEEYTYKVMKQ